jgi:hypothetical protein
MSHVWPENRRAALEIAAVVADAPANVAVMNILDRPPLGWFGLDVMRRKARKWDWCALMVDVPPDDLKSCTVEFPALFYAIPRSIALGTVRRANAGCVSLESIEPRMPPGRLLRI